MTVIGNRIRERRAKLGLSQEQLAALAHTSQKQISRYESGFNDPTGDVIIAIAYALKTSTDYLLGTTDDPMLPNLRSDLAPKEQQVLAAWRRGDREAAMAIILSDKAAVR